jgi:hypothetical protein
MLVVVQLKLSNLVENSSSAPSGGRNWLSDLPRNRRRHVILYGSSGPSVAALKIYTRRRRKAIAIGVHAPYHLRAARL